jgi:DNA integrity scanning protein DisA with diadenylate cyclase activity
MLRPPVVAEFSELGLQDVMDVAVVAVLLFIAILGLRRSGAAVAVVGFGVLGAVYWTAQRFDLVLTARILQAFFAVFVIVLVVVFQEDLRRLVERIGVWGLRRKAPQPLVPQALEKRADPPSGTRPVSL